MTRRVAARVGARLLALGAAAALGGAAAAPSEPRLAPGTPLRLMVTKEVDSRTARAGDRFRLRVNEPVVVDGATVVPVGADAWAEVTYVDGTGAVGNKGRLTARLLYVDLPGGPLPITGEQAVEGKGNTAGVAIAMVGFGLLGLLTKGGNAHFKAGDILTGYVAAPAGGGAAPTPIRPSPRE